MSVGDEMEDEHLVYPSHVGEERFDAVDERAYVRIRACLCAEIC